MQAPAPNAAPAKLTSEQVQQEISRLAARLMHLQNTGKQIEEDVKKIKAKCERLYSENAIPAKNDLELLFDDQSVQKVRLSRQETGTYFKPNEECKDEFNNLKRQIEGLFLDAGKAEMAEKACTWKAQVVK
jgi:ElaB/YqjD/DUF883 family membrane-anchored ribosome-binding protein